MKLLFIIGSPVISGGNNVIFNHALFAVEQGWDVTIASILPSNTTSTNSLWHKALGRLRFLSLDDARSETFDLAVATWWATVYYLRDITAGQYLYFVQSIESWLVPDHDQITRRSIDATYLPPLPIITEAQWIVDYLENQFDHKALLVRNGIDKNIFQQNGPVMASPLKAGQLRVLVEGPIAVDFKNVPRTIRLVKKAQPDELWLLTSSRAAWYPGVNRVFSQLPLKDTASVYRSCDVLVKLSYVEGMFGPPLEMFHCGGTAVAYDVTGHEEYMKNGVNSLIVPTCDERGVVDALQRLRDDPKLLADLREQALQTAIAWQDWPTSSMAFMDAMRVVLEMPTFPIQRAVNLLETATPRRQPVSSPSSLSQLIKSKIKKILPCSVRFAGWLNLLTHSLLTSRKQGYGTRTKECSFSKDEITRLREILQ